MPTRDGMTKDQWENKMCAFVRKMLKTSTFATSHDPSSVGVRIDYARDETTKAEWLTDVLQGAYDKARQRFVVPTAPEDVEPVETRVGQCPNPICDGKVMTTVKAKDKKLSELAPILAQGDYEACPKCGSKIMHDEMELEAMHDTEIVFLCDILSAPIAYKGGVTRLRYQGVYVIKVNGRHTDWNQQEVRQMMMELFFGSKRYPDSIQDLWKFEAESIFAEKIEELKNE